MSKSHFKASVSFSNMSLNVDEKNGIIRNVVIVQQGENKNDSYFNEAFLVDLVNQGNEQKQGVKCRFGHPNACATSLGTFLGRYKNFKLENNKVFADLFLDTISQKTEVEGKGISMWEYVVEMAGRNADMFGNSIVILSELFTEKVNEKEFDSHILHSFIASDLVDDPAATDSLFSNSSDLGVIVSDFLDNNPEVFNTIQKDPSVIEDFFGRYSAYLKTYKSNFNMSIIDKIKKQFSKDSFDIELTDATGKIIKIITEAEEPQVGDSVTDEEGGAISDGDVKLADGRTLVVSGGEISEIKPKEEESEPTLSEVMQSIDTLRGEVFGRFDKNSKENEEAILLLSSEMSSINSKFNTLARTVKSKKFDTPPAPPAPPKQKSMYDRVKEQINEKKEDNGI
ncbi:hypothetical protein ACFSTE_13310 [Aquimarina hainanensis]|uniref:Uncharacterized protein n=1 Tax=Aquimarina hainanensis TaxID=1578017 RepID=A0ABW5NAB6_9FLAO